MEEWKDILEGYQVSNLGNVRDSNKELRTQYLDRYGYNYVSLKVGHKFKLFKVHRLVAQAFLENYSDNLQVNHKNEIKTDNQVSNLEMCDNRYNCNYGSRRTALARAVIQETLNGEFVREWESTREVERVLGFSNTSVSDCCKGYKKDYHSGKMYQVHQSYGYKWKYKQ